MGLNPGTGSRIQFQFRQCLNIQRKHGGTPNAAVHAVYTLKGKKSRTMSTQHRKGKDPEWIENTSIIRDVSSETEFTFVVLDSVTSLFPAKVLLKSKPYTVGELFLLKNSQPAESTTSVLLGGGASTGFAVPLRYDSACEYRTVDDRAPSLVLSMHDFLDEKELKQYYIKVREEWTAKNRRDLELETASFTEDLRLLSADIPSSANSKTYVDVAFGLFASIGPLFDDENVVNQRLVVDLIASYRRAIEQLQFTANAQSAEFIIQYYGKVCLEIAQSLIFLERCLREPSTLKENGIIAEIDRKMRYFEHYPQNTDKPLGHRDLTPSQCANLRKSLIASNPNLVSQLNPAFDMEPTRMCRISARHPAGTIQTLASWVLLSPYPNVNRLLWLTGPAGCGKTQLANTLVDAIGRLGVSSAYFTFNNHTTGKGDLVVSNNSEVIGSGVGEATILLLPPPSLRRMTRTLAFQMAACVAGMIPLISNAAFSTSSTGAMDDDDDKNELIDFPALFDTLVVSPLQALSRSRREKNLESAESSGTKSSSHVEPPIVIILDDLDQCSPSQLEALLPVLVESVGRLPRECRVLLFSRPLQMVREVFENVPAARTIVEYAAQSKLEGGGGSPSRSSSIKWANVGNASGSGGASPPRRNSVGSLKGSKRSGKSGSLGNISEFQITEVPV